MNKKLQKREPACDPQENNPELLPIILAAAVEARRVLEQQEHLLCQGSFCHVMWRTQKQILKERHGIDWKSPSEMNSQFQSD
ncbi:MAG: hypothetical protein JO250_02245 [Armatimonadetes bacterium]|nr:hypothetical protein [Armatimonadota bacterium]